MDNVHYLKYDMWIRATYRLMDWVVECAAVWDEIPDYRQYGKLVYFQQLGPNLSMLRAAERLGTLSRKQIRELRNLERLAVNKAGEGGTGIRHPCGDVGLPPYHLPSVSWAG